MSDKKFWYAKAGEKYGSYTQKELKEKALSGDIDDTCLIWLEGTQNWIPATSVKGLLPPKFSEPPPIPSNHPSELLTSENISLQLDSVVIDADTFPEKLQKTTRNINLLIPISPERIEYNKIRLKYQDIAEKAAKDFSENWFENIDDLHDRASSVVGGYLNSAINEAICDLVAKGIQDIDEKAFFEKYLKISWEDDFSDIDDKYNAIVLKAEELDAYRTARRQNRGRFVGGGFGLEGAINGMAKAGAANLAVGVLHGTFNLGAKAVNIGINAVKKTQLFNDPYTKTSLVNAAYWQVFLVHSAYIDAVNERMPEKIISGWVSNEDKVKAERLFENVKKGRIANTEIQQILLEVLTLNPYDDTIYMYWMQTYGDDNNSLERTAEYFGITSFSEDKKTIQAILSLEDGVIPEYKCSPELAINYFDYFIKLANQGNKQAQFHLGMIYENGIGVSKDLTQAQNYYQKLAAQGFSNAQLSLGVMYENAGNENEALIWYGKAAGQGSKKALELQNKLNQKIEDWENTKKDIKEGFNKTVFYGEAIIYFGLLAFDALFIVIGVFGGLTQLSEGKIGVGLIAIPFSLLVGWGMFKLANKIKPDSIKIIDNLFGVFKKIMNTANNAIRNQLKQ